MSDLSVVERSVRIHFLKAWPDPYDAVVSGDKPYEIRVDDRDFGVGDILVLRRWDHKASSYTGEACARIVSYKTSGGTWGLPDNICVLGLRHASGLPCLPESFMEGSFTLAEFITITMDKTLERGGFWR